MSTPARSSGSMGLLELIVDEALDPGYAAVSARREEAGRRADGSSPEPAPGSRSGGRRRGRALHLGVAVVLAAAGFLAALAVLEARAGEPEASAARGALVERIEDATAFTDEQQELVDALRTEVDRNRDAALSLSEDGRDRAERLAALELSAGAVPVEGPGVRVTVDDAPSLGVPSDAPDLGKVQDRDLQIVVNGLWAAGAEAISVDGHRLTSTTAIRTAGEAILVDFRPVLPPYDVEAVGDPRTLRAAFTDGPGGQTLQALASRYGIRFGTESVDELRLAPGTARTTGEGDDR